MDALSALANRLLCLVISFCLLELYAYQDQANQYPNVGADLKPIPDLTRFHRAPPFNVPALNEMPGHVSFEHLSSG